jgi:hypothetical protein
MSKPSPAAGAVGTSSAVGTVIVEKVMVLVTSRYIDFLGIEIIDLEAPQLPEKVLDVATERMFAESSIMETTASVSKALHEYERAGDFAPHDASKVSEAVSEVPVAGMESAADAPVPPPTSESREASLRQPAEAAETTAAVAATGAAVVVVGEAGSSSSRPVAAEVDEVRVPDEPPAAVQERAAPEGTTRAASPEIQEVEETGASLSQGVTGGEARALELACTSWAATSGPGDVAEDDK